MPPEFSDPYLQSFRNKNIKYVISERLEAKDLYPDTIELDQQGNIVRIRRWGEEERRTYDSNGILLRWWLRSDITLHYIAKYSVHGDTLVQLWRKLNSHVWDLGSDTTTRPYEVNFFVLDKSGRITQSSRDGFGPTIYIYSKNKLVRKEIEIKRNNEDEFHWEKTAEYAYDDNQEIKTMKIILHDGREEDIFYFSAGLIDSCKITSYKDYGTFQARYKYRYVYYYFRH